MEVLIADGSDDRRTTIDHRKSLMLETVKTWFELFSWESDGKFENAFWIGARNHTPEEANPSPWGTRAAIGFSHDRLDLRWRVTTNSGWSGKTAQGAGRRLRRGVEAAEEEERMGGGRVGE
ncbi:hypothetical protein LWI29_014928 [Acer saccharum]|uniref:Uncharacterized protein n=1 Tax=Acer saccharum TaxID=4024 RepID=A0AA39RZS8_ACESA|nr:hypothetical protein LWI29_014928 [Acer saccharum]